jgi:hypothetical protein
METPPNPQVYDLGHLGLVASVLDRIRLVESVGRLVGPRPGEKVSTGMALKAAIPKRSPNGEAGTPSGRVWKRLEETGSSLPDQKGRPTQRPTLRWVFQLFLWVRLVELEGRPRVLNLAPHHETAVRLLGVQRYYLLE